MTTTQIDLETQALLRALAPEVLGKMLRRYRDLPEVEDAVQEALIAAATLWPRDAKPANPMGWLLRVAGRRLTDQVRSDAARRHREALVVSLIPIDEQVALAADEAFSERDDTLDLLFTCCHPSLTTSSAVALTLRAVGGLTTREIASAFLVPEANMAQRISRAKQTVKDSDTPFSVPEGPEREARLSHAIALAMVHGTSAGIARLVELEADPRLRNHHRLEAARAHLLERDGKIGDAMAAYRRAADLTASIAERDYLVMQASRLGET